ncbi:EGF-like domain-containing protein [Phthorimaea operculella]|nr:EGF-like domain-containing protein [Phthorimaea operculella]
MGSLPEPVFDRVLSSGKQRAEWPARRPTVVLLEWLTQEKWAIKKAMSGPDVNKSPEDAQAHGRNEHTIRVDCHIVHPGGDQTTLPVKSKRHARCGCADPMRRARSLPAVLLALALALACLTHSAAGAGVFELQILEFALCLKEYQSAAAPGACSFGRAASPVLGTDSFTLAEPLYTLSLPFSFRWTRSFTLILQAYDDHNYTDPDESGLIEEAWWSGIVEPGAEWHALRHAGSAASLAYRVRVTCQPNYYNATCTTFCRPRDDKFGHYSCSPQGDKRCLPGWQGDNCEKPVCKEGCHPTHGRCDHPGDCDCRPGWRGELCSQCQPYPGCKHGYCNGSSWDCTCDTNWGGILCDQDLNYCGTHEPCQHGGTCENTAPDQYLCTCAEGFSGVDCERVDNPCAPQPCKHGVCELSTTPPGFECTCEPGWSGALCDRDVDDCASAPCAHGATCRDLVNAFACECASGWTGNTCTDDVDECATIREGSETTTTDTPLGPCVNAAACNNTAGGYSCTCLAGWTGRDCEVNVDDCTGQCLHGATCIDLVDDFHCACAAGYAGRTCARDIDDCASRPCRNGGECVDLLDAYRCICPVGFSGKDCEDDRDHCAGNPCGNGAPCYTAQSDYYCHCAPGWTGKNCTTRAPPPPPRDREPCVGGAVCLHGHCLHPSTATSTAATAPRCVCSPGYAGPLCTERIEDCVVSGCGSGGSCLDTGAGARCVCRAGWTGARCELEIDECAMNPCRNNATCVDGPADFACLCPEGWTGKTCSVRIEGGHCGSGWACACRDGWAGARCELALDGCASAPCRNGGRCVGGAGWWACECGSAWAGPDCSAPRAACSPPCPAPAICAHDALGARCVCPEAPARAATRCLENIAGLGFEDTAANDGADGSEITEAEEESRGGTSGRWGGAGGGCTTNGTWWWGCNACACGAPGATPVCTRLWCGLPDCLAPRASPCRTDEVCVPAAPALFSPMDRRCDEEKSNNLQNEENLRRYANPLRDEPMPLTHSHAHAHAHGAPADELPRAHSLYKAQNADARNNTPPRDKELTKRALPPPEPPPARRAPPERLTVLV